MPTTDRQLNANRQNAQKSTGPRTPEGKAASSRNAITHGLHATDIVIDSPHLKENLEDYNQLVASLMEELDPIGVFQEHLVMKIANCMWRYRRVINAESALIHDRLDDFASDLASYHRLFGGDTTNDGMKMKTRCLPSPDNSRHILHYEMRLDRQLSRAYSQLLHLKRLEDASRREAARKSRRTPTTRYRDRDRTPDHSAWPNDEHPSPAFVQNEPNSSQLPPRIDLIPGGRL